MELVPKTDYPDFNLLGLLLGGRPYAAQHFTQRAQIDMQNQEEARRAGFADNLMASPEMRAANENPWDRKGQWALWAAAQHGPDSAAQMGANYLGQMIGATNARENEAYSDQLARARIQLSADAQVSVARRTKEIEAQAEQQRFDALFGPSDVPGMTNAQAQLMRNKAFEDLSGQKVPQGYDVRPGDNGLTFTPTLGSEAWQKMAGEMQDAMAAEGLVADLEQQIQKGGNKGEFQATRSLLMLKYKRLEQLGALDAGSVEFLDSMIPKEWDNWNLNMSGHQGDMIQEKLRVLRKRNQEAQAYLKDKWQIPADRMDLLPNRSEYRAGTPYKAEDLGIKPPSQALLDQEWAAEQQRRKLQEGPSDKAGGW